MNQETEQFYYPNKMGRIILQAMEEVIGHIGVNAVLNLANLSSRINNYPPDNLDRAFRFDELSQIQIALESLYGPRGGRGVALRTGRACFKYGLREFGPLLGVTDLAFRLLPADSKLRVGADIFVDAFNKFSDQVVRVVEEPEHFLWYIDCCPICWKRRTEVPVCHLAVGILQEALYWASNGKVFHVEETACIAMGDSTCTIAIEKQPLD
jgi:predicted hydrocarbon binding protein